MSCKTAGFPCTQMAKDCQSTRIDPAPKIGPVGAGRTWMRIETTYAEHTASLLGCNVDPGRKCFISNISILLVVSLLVCDGEESHCFGVSSPLYKSPEITCCWCFTQWSAIWTILVAWKPTGFWDPWATPLGFLGRLVASIKPHVMDVSCVVAAMKTWRRCDGGRGAGGVEGWRNPPTGNPQQ